MKTVTIYYNTTTQKVMYLLDETVTRDFYSFYARVHLLHKPRNLGGLGKLVVDRRLFLRYLVKTIKSNFNSFYIAINRIHTYTHKRFVYDSLIVRFNLYLCKHPTNQIEFLKKAI